MFVIYNSINITIKYYGLMLGYEKGVEFITSGEQSKAIETIINMSTAVRVIVFGALIGSYVRLQVRTEFNFGEAVVNIQDLLDGILPKLLPLLFTLGLYKLHGKMPRKYLIWLIFAILILGTILASFGILV